MPRSRCIPAPITASHFRNGRFTIATPPSGIGNGCWRSIAAISRHETIGGDDGYQDQGLPELGCGRLEPDCRLGLRPVSRPVPGLAGNAHRAFENLGARHRRRNHSTFGVAYAVYTKAL